MTKLLEQAIEAARLLPEEAQNELAEVISRQIIEARLAKSDAAYAAHGGTPAEEVFDRLALKYGG